MKTLPDTIREERENIASGMYSGHWPEITRMAMTKLEEMAKAVYDFGEADSGQNHGRYDELGPEMQEFCRGMVRAVLKAGRRPDMNLCLQIGRKTSLGGGVIDMAWTHYIDALLEEK